MTETLCSAGERPWLRPGWRPPTWSAATDNSCPDLVLPASPGGQQLLHHQHCVNQLQPGKMVVILSISKPCVRCSHGSPHCSKHCSRQDAGRQS